MLKTPSAIVLGFFVVLALPAIPAQAIDLNPFSVIKGAVKAAKEKLPTLIDAAEQTHVTLTAN